MHSVLIFRKKDWVLSQRPIHLHVQHAGGNFDRRDNATGKPPQPNALPIWPISAVLKADSCGSSGYELAVFNVSVQSD